MHESEEEAQESLHVEIKNFALQPVYIALSKPARRAYLTTFLLSFASVALFVAAVISYVLFYTSFVPRIGFSREVYLQFDHVYIPSDDKYAGPHPYGIASLRPDIVGVQEYDVSVELVLPRTCDNINAGNFMLELSMYAPAGSKPARNNAIHREMLSDALQPEALVVSRRPAILPFRSRLVDLAYRITGLQWYLLNWRQETDHLAINMFERLEFPKGWRNVPAALKLEVQSKPRLQIYSARVIFRARLKGLRWFMYNHRVMSALVFVGAFWATELVFASAAWALFHRAPAMTPGKRIKSESPAAKIKTELMDEPQLSDTERTFPTTSAQMPLRYTAASPVIKREDDDFQSEVALPLLDADDEDDYDELGKDSGLGTSMDSGYPSRKESVRKRKGRRGALERG
ncbi:hypothetical protein K470DRAFT_232734 [Piedraia hortae CBS 480.64]|uniref:DUF1226-domain-containing protein n=1 Tax=Piedraia hortae CBS 480.64 TaxID=1314780 RepID=A0A6A7BZ38_9PEZI|nr:hypothetical protein K470DRAFT_232734 [Piedraia hortae CBS 480.64]